MTADLQAALELLAAEFRTLDFTFHHFHEAGRDYIKNFWPGTEEENIMVCVYQGDDIREPFHRHDFFYFNFAFANAYAALSDTDGNLITINENECYIGQPYSGYALRSLKGVQSTIVGVLIKKEFFFRSMLQTFVSDNALFHFFLNPEKDRFSDKFLHLSFPNSEQIRRILALMVVEYANRTQRTQQMLLPLAISLYLLVARAYHEQHAGKQKDTISAILGYINDNFSTVSLNELSEEFSYHPAYISGLLKQETGRTFTQILLANRMEHALVLMKGTDLANEEIADALGYTSTTNFYKAFRRYFGTSPREYMAKMMRKEQAYPLSQR